jgi:hypothetical protein
VKKYLTHAVRVSVEVKPAAAAKPQTGAHK